MNPVTIPVYCNNDETNTKELIGKDDVSFDEYDIRPCVFYHIAAIGSYLEKTKKGEGYHAVIEANGMTFHSPLNMQEVNLLIFFKQQDGLAGKIPTSLRERLDGIRTKYPDEFKNY